MTSAAGTARDGAATHTDAALERESERERLRQLGRSSTAERLSLAVSTAAFLAAGIALALFIPTDRSPSALVVIGLIVAYAAAFEFDFAVPAGSAVPTQLVLVPMLFALPIGMVPLAVAGGILLASAFDAVRGPLGADRIVLRLMSGWNSIGPVIVLGFAGERGPAVADWSLYVLALAAQFAVSFAVAAVRGWVVLRVSPLAELHAMRWVSLVDGVLGLAGLVVTLGAVRSSEAVVIAVPVLALAAVLVRERRGRLDHELELRDAYRRVASLVGDERIETRDVVRLTLLVADRLGLSARDRRDAEFGALLHGVGKAAIPRAVLEKPGPLTDPEWAVVRRHTVEAERMLMRVGGLVGSVGRIVRSCNERYDGRGYPDGLAGERIPLAARIVAACAAFEAMRSDRAYRKALSFEAAVEELRRNRGTQFDPRVVDALVEVLERG